VGNYTRVGRLRKFTWAALKNRPIVPVESLWVHSPPLAA
jgi:hypothetical protein